MLLQRQPQDIRCRHDIDVAVIAQMFERVEVQAVVHMDVTSVAAAIITLPATALPLALWANHASVVHDACEAHQCQCHQSGADQRHGNAAKHEGSGVSINAFDECTEGGIQDG